MEDSEQNNLSPAAMSHPQDNLENTQPSTAHKTNVNTDTGDDLQSPTRAEPPFEPPPTDPQPAEIKPKRSALWILWVVGGLLIIILIAMTSVYSGYLAAIDQRTAFQATRNATEAQSQYALALVDIEMKNFSQARQRLEYIVQIDPGFPGVGDKLAEVMVAMSITATPTPVPTQVPTPTLDLRDREELYLRSRELMAGADWSNAIDTLLALRKKDPTYMAVEVDGLLFVCLRNRGVDKISRRADLEGGTYDLALAEAFGPLDVEANNWRSWAVMYIRGASFWGVDWEQAVFYFHDIASIAPNLMDSSMMPATERYYQALLKYGDWLAQQGRWCDAQLQYEAAQNMRSNDSVQPTAEYSFQQCSAPESGSPSEPTVEGPTPTPTPTLSETPGEGQVTETPTPTTGANP